MFSIFSSHIHYSRISLIVTHQCGRVAHSEIHGPISSTLDTLSSKFLAIFLSSNIVLLSELGSTTTTTTTTGD